MADSLLPNHSTQSIIVNSRVLQRQLQSQNYPKFLENFEEIPLKDRKEEINRKMEKSDFRTDESNLKTKDINLSNLQINQSFDNNRNAGYMRSSIQKKKIFDENYLSSSKLNGLGSNYQNYKKQRTFSTQIYDNTQTENSFTQVNQSLNYQSFNQNRMHLLSFQDDDMIIQPNNQQEKDSQMKLIQDILSQFKKEITKDQSNAFDQLRYFVNSNEQQINTLICI